MFVARESGQRDIVVGSPVAGRADGRFADTVGLFVDTMMVRSRVSPSETFAGAVARTGGTVFDAFGNLQVPFDVLVDRLGTSRDPSYGAVVQLMFAYHEKPSALKVVDGLRLTHRVGSTGTAKFDVTFSVYSADDGYDVEVEYCIDLFERRTAERFFAHFGELLRGALSGRTFRSAKFRSHRPLRWSWCGRGRRWWESRSGVLPSACF